MTGAAPPQHLLPIMKTDLDDPAIEMAVRLRLACEAHDPTIGPHLDRVAGHACRIGRCLGLPEAQILQLRHIAPLHDLGKLGLPLPLLQKEGPLTSNEMEMVKTHTLIGYRILSGSPLALIEAAARVALSHHECWDGSGYPNGLREEEIPLEARIVSVADVFDALLSERAYKPAWGADTAVAEMMRLRGAKFDPLIVDLFLEDVRTFSGCGDCRH